MKKGFTLIELLAVIIVLAVIALIATPIVLDVIDSAKLKAFEESAYGIIETVKLKNYDSMLENNDKTYIFPTDELVFQGERPKGGTVISVNGEIILAIHNGKYCATKKFGDEKVTVSENIENCDLKQYSLSGNISAIDTYLASETYDQTIKVKGKVQLIKNNNIIYETTSDENGNYSFDKVVEGEYLLLVSQNYKTKYGFKINLSENTVKDIEATLQYGDFNNDNIIDSYDESYIVGCYLAEIEKRPECIDYDINKDGYINAKDLTIIKNLFSKTTKIEMGEEKFSVSGKVTADRGLVLSENIESVIIENGKDKYEAILNENGTYLFENIPSGSYMIYINYFGLRYGVYEKFIILDSDTNIDIHFYYGDLDGNKIIDEQDMVSLEQAIKRFEENGINTITKRYDLNDDDVLDKKDVEILKSQIEKYQKMKSNNLCF